MRVTKVELDDFKLFKSLTLEGISATTDLVILIGPNGSGKSCIFDAFNVLVRIPKKGNYDQDGYYYSNVKLEGNIDYLKKVKIYDENSSLITTGQYTPNQSGTIKIYGRSSYRFTKSIESTNISIQSAQNVMMDSDSPDKLSDLDKRLNNDVEKALGQMIQFAQSETETTNTEVRKQIIGNVNLSLAKIFPESGLKLKQILEPFSDQSNGKIDLLFSKGSKEFTFEMLSSGEKEIFDIIFNFHMRKDFWLKDGVYFIDEPELHINTKIQSLLLRELVELCSLNNTQLWIATHSIGFMKEAQSLKNNSPEKVAVFEFDEKLAEKQVTLLPIDGTKDDWKRIFSTALAELTELLAPEVIIYCEGKKEPNPDQSEAGLDANVYNEIFKLTRNDALFVSSGGGTQPEDYSEIAMNVLSKAFSKTELLVLRDRDIRGDGNITTQDERTAYISGGSSRRMLKRREIENYLFDKEIIKLHCVNNNIEFQEGKYDELVKDLNDQDLKIVAGDLKNLVSFNKRGANTEAFKLELAKSVIPATTVYKELYECIFA